MINKTWLFYPMRYIAENVIARAVGDDGYPSLYSGQAVARPKQSPRVDEEIASSSKRPM
jgi:hypothetical protein